MRGDARRRKAGKWWVGLEWRENAAGIKTKNEEQQLNDTATYHDNKLALIGDVVHQLDSQDEGHRSTIFVGAPAQTRDSDKDILGRPAL